MAIVAIDVVKVVVVPRFANAGVALTLAVAAVPAVTVVATEFVLAITA